MLQSADRDLANHRFQRIMKAMLIIDEKLKFSDPMNRYTLIRKLRKYRRMLSDCHRHPLQGYLVDGHVKGWDNFERFQSLIRSMS